MDVVKFTNSSGRRISYFQTRVVVVYVSTQMIKKTKNRRILAETGNFAGSLIGENNYLRRIDSNVQTVFRRQENTCTTVVNQTNYSNFHGEQSFGRKMHSRNVWRNKTRMNKKKKSTRSFVGDTRLVGYSQTNNTDEKNKSMKLKLYRSHYIG